MQVSVIISGPCFVVVTDSPGLQMRVDHFMIPSSVKYDHARTQEYKSV